MIKNQRQRCSFSSTDKKEIVKRRLSNKRLTIILPAYFKAEVKENK